MGALLTPSQFDYLNRKLLAQGKYVADADLVTGVTCYRVLAVRSLPKWIHANAPCGKQLELILPLKRPAAGRNAKKWFARMRQAAGLPARDEEQKPAK